MHFVLSSLELGDEKKNSVMKDELCARVLSIVASNNMAYYIGNVLWSRIDMKTFHLFLDASRTTLPQLYQQHISTTQTRMSGIPPGPPPGRPPVANVPYIPQPGAPAAPPFRPPAAPGFGFPPGPPPGMPFSAGGLPPPLPPGWSEHRGRFYCS